MGQKALVTSGSKGLGKAVVRKLLENNITTHFTTSNPENLNIFQNFTDVFGIKCDIFNENDVDNLIETINKEKYEILVINSPGPKTGDVFDIKPEEWQQHFNSIFLNPVRIMETAAKHMIEKRFGRILVITSVSVKKPIDNLLISNCLRAAITSYVKSLAKKLAPHGITANTIAPGYTLTDRVQFLIEDRMKREGKSYDEIYDLIAENIPMKRIASVEEFANAAFFLLTEEASYITGTSLVVDGGMTDYPF